MSAPAALSRGCRVYVVIVSGVGALVLSHAVSQFAHTTPPLALALFAAVALVSGPLAFRIPSLNTTISVSETIAFAAALLFGPAAGVLTALADGVGILLSARQRDGYRTLFNIFEPVICVGLAAGVFYATSGLPPLLYTAPALTPLLLPILLMVGTYFALNTLIAGTVVWLESRERPLVLLRSHVPHLAANFCVSVSLAAMIVRTSESVLTVAVVVLAPMLVLSYLSSNTVAGRLEDANRHLVELRRLYHSTIETLAMAIDAKDQVTHGHIRRVQALSLRLATAMGASSDELKALEAAALLHDLGKLAVPEHILNKPGKLTPAEFDQMKQHAGIGASMLAGIEFPFPVAPIVRHHHETWDGTGYPDGLRGAAIPLGARILSVVDCYDALTSDRPYRRRLTPAESLDMIRARSGTAYDPAVVDAFVRVYDSLPLETDGPDDGSASALHLSLVRGPEARTLGASEHGSRRGSRQATIDAFVKTIDGRNEDGLSEALSSIVSASCNEAVSVLYPYNALSNQLTRVDGPEMPRGLPLVSLQLGDGVSGWVAANRRAMTNADAALDLGDGASALTPPLRACISVPVLHEGDLAGVWTVYSPYAFSEPQSELIQGVALTLGRALAQARHPHAA
ncbi:MAG: HD domain-containing phosphohydrolase [Acidobacteriota bacterium]